MVDGAKIDLAVIDDARCTYVKLDDFGEWRCRMPADHGGTHDLWPVEDTSEFLPPPFENSCTDVYTWMPGEHEQHLLPIKFMCCKPAGHAGSHGHPHGPDGSVIYWGEATLEPASIGAWGGNKHEAAFDIVIPGGAKAVAHRVRLNGLELPNVKSLSVEYEAGLPRTVLLEIFATDIREVPE